MSEHNSRNWFVRHKILTAILALIVIIAIGSAAGGNKTDNTSNNSNNNQAASTKSSNKSAVAKIGETARDGKFEFVVKTMTCGQTEVVSPDSNALRKTAQGQFCTVAMSVKNIGDQQQGFFSMNQKLLDSQSKQYGADDSATAYASPLSQQNTWSQINPGNSIDATIVFDVPKNVTPVTAELHDSAYSGGVKVSLQ